MSPVTPLIVRCVRRTQLVRLLAAALGRLPHRREHAAEPLVHARAPIRIARDQLPVDVVFERAREQHREPHAVGSPPLDERHGLDDVALRLGHRRASVDHLPLVHQARERLDVRNHPGVVQRLREEPRVEQVQDRVLDAPGVLADRPSFDVLPPERSLLVRPGSSTGRSTSWSRRTCPSCPSRVARHDRTSGRWSSRTGRDARAATRPPGGSRRPRGARTGRSASGTATSPCSSQWMMGIGAPQYRWRRDQPVAQPERDGGTAELLLLEPSRDLRDRRGRALAVERSRVHHHALVVVGLRHRGGVALHPRWLDHDADRRGRARARTRSRADRGRALPSRRPSRTPSARRAPRRPAPARRSRGSPTCTPRGTPSRLSACSRFVSGVACRRSTSSRAASDVPPSSASFDTSGCSGANTKNVTPQSVSGPRGEDLDLVAGLLDREPDRRPLGAPDPVPLHRDAPARATPPRCPRRRAAAARSR